MTQRHRARDISPVASTTNVGRADGVNGNEPTLLSPAVSQAERLWLPLTCFRLLGKTESDEKSKVCG